MKEFVFHKLYFCYDEDKIYCLGYGNKANTIDDTKNVFNIPQNRTNCFTFQEAQIAGRNHNAHHGDKYIHTSESELLKYCWHNESKALHGEVLEIVTSNDIIQFKTIYYYYEKSDTISCNSIITNISNKPITLEYVSSFSFLGLGKFGCDSIDDLNLYIPYNSWHCEFQWQKKSFRELGLANGNRNLSMKKVSLNNTGTWSSKEFLPMGIIEDSSLNTLICWQIENNGSWHAEIGDFKNLFYLNLSGGEFLDNHWAKVLYPNKSFETVKVALNISNSLNELAIKITNYRRQIRLPNFDNEKNPTIFNEYMHAAWNAPSEERTKELSKTVSSLGIEYYVIDCCWHDEQENCWNYIGKWQESKLRYPNGLKNTFDYLRSLKLKAGIWLELEAVGIEGDAKNQWTKNDFFVRNGETVINSGRYQLDFRSSNVIMFMNNLIDRIVNDYKVSYIKIDYNQDGGPGTEINSESLGNGLQEHCNAYFMWMKSIVEKYPKIIIENCASGGMRLDYKTLQLHSIQSTSDQTDYKKYPYIIGNMYLALTPEQAGVWSYPLEDGELSSNVSDNVIEFNMVNTIMGRFYLSSNIDKLSENQLLLIKEGVNYYNSFARQKAKSLPFMPLGFSKFGDSLVSVGLIIKNKIYLAIWNLNGNKKVKIDINKFLIENFVIGYPINSSVKIKNNITNLEIVFDKDYQALIVELSI